MKEIPLTKGAVAIVDDEDYERISKHRWFVAICYSSRYAVRSSIRDDGKQRTIFMHHEVLPCASGFVIDHKNGDQLDNRRCNLRIATRRQNTANSRKRRNSSSQYKGVSWYKPRKQWLALITLSGKGTSLGFFDKEIDAAKAYDAAALVEYGEFARINFPDVKL